MRSRSRTAFTLFQLLVILAFLAILFAMLLPAIVKVRESAERMKALNNLKQIALACHNYHDTNAAFPPGNDGNNFSALARLLPYLEQDNVYRQIDFKKPMDDKANATIRKVQIPTLVSSRDPQTVKGEYGPTNYLMNAGSKYALADNDGVFYQDSKIKIQDITDGTSNTIMAGETLRGDGGSKAIDVKRQHVLLDKGALKDLKEEAGVQDFQESKHIAGDRGASWMDGRFLQSAFTGTRLLNDARPDVNCGGLGGLSALRSMDDEIAVAFCDGSCRTIKMGKIKMEVWKALVTRNGGEVISADF